ncbi:MAG: hypothetical protein MZW92_15660 [Comamonadaceae bacterium]|nr:hypothetical protein [Comamonadaceae bacterium]
MPQDDQAFVSVAMQHPTDYAIETGAIGASDGLRIDAGRLRRALRRASRTPLHRAVQHLSSASLIWSGRWRASTSTTTHLPEAGQGPAGRNGPRAAQPQPVPQPDGARGGNPAGAARSPAPARRLSDAGFALGAGHAARRRGHRLHRSTARPAVASLRNGRLPAAWSTRASCRRPARTRGASRKTCGCRCSTSDSIMPDDALRLHCEQVIRNYDPCISCATHFLRMNVERT